MDGEKQTEMIDPSTINNVNIAVFAPQDDDLCVSEAFWRLKTQYINLMPDIKHKHFDTASDKEFVDELINQLTIIEEGKSQTNENVLEEKGVEKEI